MTIYEIIVISIALAMDCFTVSIAAGTSSRRIIAAPMLYMALAFGIFQGGMTWMGYEGISLFSNYLAPVDHWIAFALLVYIGVKMILSSCSTDDEPKFSMMNYWTITLLAIATSIDAFAVGISLCCAAEATTCSLTTIVAWIAATSTVLTLVGLGIGIFIGKTTRLRAEWVGGIILILIGIKILWEHLT